MPHEKNPSSDDCYLLATDWFDSAGLHAHQWQKEVRIAENRVRLKVPTGLEAPVHWRLRKLGREPPEPKQGRVIMIPDGIVVGGDAAVAAPDGRCILELSPGREANTAWRNPLHRGSRQRLRRTSDTIAVIAPRTSGAYYHWMLDVLPTVYLLQLCGIRPDRYVIHGKRPAPFQRETMAKLGIDSRSILVSEDSLCLQAKTIVVPQLTQGLRPQWACRFLRDALLGLTEYADKSGTRTRLYISRALASKRRVTNESEIAAVFADRGFQFIQPECMPLDKQLRLFASAEAIAGPHGSGLTNMLFCPPGAKVVELFSPLFVHTFFPLLSQVLGHSHYYLIGEGERPPEGTLPPNSRPDMHINPNELRRLLDLAQL